MRFTVNGQPVQYRLDPATPLLWALRDASNLTGAKYGCGTGECGACTVNVNGEAVRSCQLPIGRLEGSAVTTIEGLSPDRGQPVQQAFVEGWAVQCGFCIPGMIMAAAALIDRNPAPIDAEIDAAITNICRCGNYPKLREVVRRAGRARAGGEPIVAAPPPRVDPADAARAVPALRAAPQD